MGKSPSHRLSDMTFVESWYGKAHSPNFLKEKCISEVVRVGSVIIFHLSEV